MAIFEAWPRAAEWKLVEVSIYRLYRRLEESRQIRHVLWNASLCVTARLLETLPVVSSGLRTTS